MSEKVTKMVLTLDLQCPCCCKKIKKILVQFPEITSAIYDKKKNTVTITVESSNPEKIRCKLLCKGGKTIKSIEIIKEPPKDGKKEKDDKPKDTGKSAGGNTEVTTIVCGPTIGGYPTSCPVPVCSRPRCDCNSGGHHGCGRPAHGCPPVNPDPDCCGSCSEGNRGGQCNRGCRRPAPCDDRCGRPACGRPTPCHDGCGSGSGGCTPM